MMSSFGRNDICSIQMTGNSTSTSSTTAVPSSSTRRPRAGPDSRHARIGRASASAGYSCAPRPVSSRPMSRLSRNTPATISVAIALP